MKSTPNSSRFNHQVIIPVYIPGNEGYFKDGFKNFQLCITSLLQTSHDKTFFTVINNGSHSDVRSYLDSLRADGKINEVIHTENIGKANAIVKGLLSHHTELVTITDADVLFLSGWQRETAAIFKAFPKAGVVGIVPQYKMFTYKTHNILFDYMFSRKLKFIPVKNPVAMENFYHSIGREITNRDWFELSLGLSAGDFDVYAGSGHFVATYKRDIFDEVPTFFKYKLGGGSLQYFDGRGLHKDYWRLTTHDNFAYHMGNVHEKWMDDVTFEKETSELDYAFPVSEKMNAVMYFVKNKLFYKLFTSRRFRRFYYKVKKLPKHMIFRY